MKERVRLLMLWVMSLAISLSTASAQSGTAISGTVVDAADGDPLIGVNILVKGKVIGTITDLNGNFSLKLNDAPPLTIVVSSVGYTPKEVEVTQAETSNLKIELAEQAILGQEVVVSASRVEESILQSPVSIEKMDIRDIQSAAAPSFYDQIVNLKGIDVSAQSMTFKSINPRGFGANGNTRTVQLIDGIDNQAPGLNFPVGNIVGIPELDLESVEILPGSASALYG
ncbi:MAG: carboxypeptidase-like regulatory domain-containing protein, partial [Cyclobacteriaceae bacterium]